MSGQKMKDYSARTWRDMRRTRYFYKLGKARMWLERSGGGVIERRALIHRRTLS